ncbi:DUF4406 domain-containing protein [uncultured Treponema sp.]|uniref:DUF4406 domain-containing protein n=2 Tax=Treponema TaxID=157 RepID=UPI00258FE001|nr:DUF4406 domain-containing protein [uncultured Treponema sp.]
MKVYIAGKVTGLEKAEVLKKFNESVSQLKKQGYITMSPAVLASNEGFEHSDYMHVCFAMIDVCDAVYMQKDWRNSKGARMELQYAKKCKKRILYEDASTREDSEQNEEKSMAGTSGSKSEKEKCRFRHFRADIPPGIIAAPQAEFPAVPCYEKYGCENCAYRTQKEKEL